MTTPSLSHQATTNLQEWRKETRLSRNEMAQRVAQMGVPMSVDMLANFELHRGRQELNLQELMAFALVLNVSPADLLLNDADVLALTPNVTARALRIRGWLRGDSALGYEVREGLGEPSITADDLAEEHRQFLRKAPIDEWRRWHTSGHPAVVEIGLLEMWVRETLDRIDFPLNELGQNEEAGLERVDAPLAAQALRDALAKVSRHVEELAERIEREGYGQ